MGIFKQGKSKLGKKPMRTREEVKNEYLTLCAEYGGKQYQMEVIKQEVAGICERLRQLNQEAFLIEQATPKTETQEGTVQ